MISVAQAKQIILENISDFGIEEIPFLQSDGRVLKEDILADRDFPPFNRVMMDGIAINHHYFNQGKHHFKIEGIQPAGGLPQRLNNEANCYEVMTGAVLPENCDTVIRYEDIKINNLVASILATKVTKGQHIHHKGKDRKQHEILIPKNTLITAAEIGVLATVGKAFVKVAKTPKIMVISTGNELVAISEIPQAHQIRKSNVFTLVSLLKKLNISAATTHLPDSKEVLKIKIKKYLQEFDVLLFSGAVSKGKFDFLPEVLEELGVKKLFHTVSQRPGKPFWFGQFTSYHKTNRLLKKNTNIFAFPGNPISTFVNCLMYFYPWYYTTLEVEYKEETAILGTDVNFIPNLTYFLQVTLVHKFGQITAYPVLGNGSGDLVSLVDATGFIILPKTQETLFKKGTCFPVISYRNYKY